MTPLCVPQISLTCFWMGPRKRGGDTQGKAFFFPPRIKIYNIMSAHYRDFCLCLFLSLWNLWICFMVKLLHVLILKWWDTSSHLAVDRVSDWSLCSWSHSVTFNLQHSIIFVKANPFHCLGALFAPALLTMWLLSDHSSPLSSTTLQPHPSSSPSLTRPVAFLSCPLCTQHSPLLGISCWGYSGSGSPFSSFRSQPKVFK